jgi:hypothetical protein
VFVESAGNREIFMVARQGRINSSGLGKARDVISVDTVPARIWKVPSSTPMTCAGSLSADGLLTVCLRPAHRAVHP